MMKDSIREMMQMMVRTSRAKRSLLQAGTHIPSMGTSPEVQIHDHAIRRSGYIGKRLRLHRMPGDPDAITRERIALRELFRQGSPSTLILEYPGSAPAIPDRVRTAGVAGS